MAVQVQEITEVKKRVQITAPASDVVSAFDAAYTEIGKKANLKGFRPGKVPRNVLEQYYRQDAERMAIQHLLDQHVPPAIREAELSPVAPPEISIIQFGADQDFIFAALVEVRPKFEVKGFEGLKLTKSPVEVGSEEIEQQLEALRHRYATHIPLTEKRAVRQGDVVVIDYRGFLDGKALDPQPIENYSAEIGRGFLAPGFEEKLFQMSVGEMQHIPVSFPPEFHDKRYAGKTVNYEVTLKDVREKKLPALDDEFAKDVGNIQNLKELKEKIHEELMKGKEQMEKNKMRHQIVDQLIEKNSFLAPEGMIVGEMEAMFHNLENNLKAQGATLEQAGVNKEEFLEKSKPEAERNVRGFLIFERLGEQLKMAVTDEEVEKRFQEIARVVRQPLPQLRKYYHEKNLFPQIAEQVRMDKTLDYVLDKAKIKVKKESDKEKK